MNKRAIIEELNYNWEDSPDGGFDQALRFLASSEGSYPEEYLKILQVDSLQRIANALDSEPEPAFTYKEFFRVFNNTSKACYAKGNPLAGVLIISNYDGSIMANLDLDSNIWDFKEGYFPISELSLMVKIASVPPKLRGNLANDYTTKK